MKHFTAFFKQHQRITWTATSLYKVLAWLCFFFFEYLAMAMLQGSILVSGRERYLWLLCGFLLSYSFIRFAFQTLKQPMQVYAKRIRQRFSFKKVDWTKRSEWLNLAGIYLISLSGMMIWGVFEQLFLSKWTSGTTENQAALDDLMHFSGIYSTVVLSFIIVVMGPLMEELVFRGLFFHYFKWAKAPWVTVILSGLLFGLYHLGSYTWLSLLDLPPYLIIGTGLAYAYNKTGKLSSSILMHMFHNGWIQGMSLLVLLR